MTDLPTLSVVPSPTLGSITTHNPSTGEVLSTIPLPSPETITQTVQQAHNAFRRFSTTPLHKRSALLLRIAHRLEEHGDALARAICEEMGKPVPIAYDTDVTLAVANLRYMAKVGPIHLSPKANNGLTAMVLGRTHQTVRQPKGVVAVISPWNYPLAIPASGIGTALMAGNAVILKPSEVTPHVGKLLIEQIRLALEDTDCPPDTVQCLVGDGSTGKQLLEQKIDHVLFTGSGKAGRAIQAQVAEKGIHANVELGGNCPMVALPDAVSTDTQQRDIARQAVWGRCYNSGQSCAAVKRLLVPDIYAESMVQHLKTLMEELVIGNPLTNPVHLGPLATQKQRDQLHRQVVDAIAQGGKLITGGFLPGAPMDVGAYYPPTIITNIPPQSPILKDEVFGPVLLVQPYKNVDDAMTLANGTPYGLTASVFSADPVAAHAVAQKLHAGLVAINDVALVHYGFQHVPWHGHKSSGPGLSHSIRALDDCSEFKTIATNNTFTWPGQSSPPWLFNKSPYPTAVSTFSHAMLNLLSKNPVSALFQPELLKGLWQHRSKNQL